MNADPHRNALAAIVADMAKGEMTSAEGRLRRILAAGPHPIAFYLLGRVDAERGEWSKAVAHYHAALAISPGQPQVMAHLAHALRALGQPEDAVAVCDQGLRSAPDDHDLAMEMAGAQEDVGAIADAEKIYRRLLDHSGQADAPALACLADLLNRSGRAAEAMALLRQASLPPDAAERAALEHQLGISLKRHHHYAEALASMERASKIGGDRREWALDRANLLRHLRRFTEAASLYRAMLDANPLDLGVHRLLGELESQEDTAFASYDAAMERAPRAVQLPVAKGTMLLAVGKSAEAEAAFRRALQFAPDHPGALTGLARSLEALGDLAGARVAHRKSASVAPQDGETLEHFAAFLLRQDEPAEAATLAESACRLRPASQLAIALLGLSWRALGDSRDEALNRYGDHVQVIELEPPEGYTDMEAFNRELSAYLDRQHGSAMEYFTQTLRRGTQLHDDLFSGGHNLVDRLRRRIDEAIRHYAAALPASQKHPFSSRRSRGFRYAGSWSSRLTDCGFHVNHIHQQGWISSCYYVAVPEVVTDTAARQGWLKFGEAPEEFGSRFRPQRMVQPKPGLLVLFPSYMWHGTIPFHSAQSRTTIAFDAVPA
jgi:tetratricopeptide (TPR) repeat protein